LFRIPNALAGLWKSLKLYKAEEPMDSTQVDELDTLMDSLRRPRIPLDDIIIPEKELKCKSTMQALAESKRSDLSISVIRVAKLQNTLDSWTGPAAEMVRDALFWIQDWITRSSAEVVDTWAAKNPRDAAMALMADQEAKRFWRSGKVYKVVPDHKASLDSNTCFKCRITLRESLFKGPTQGAGVYCSDIDRPEEHQEHRTHN
jgi:hypothetical protein